jgi:O-methyltransferase/methyltransferase family protein
MTETDPARELMRLVNGYQVSQAIHVAATLGLADRLQDGPRSVDELAAATGSHPGSLYRLLRALAAVGVFHEDGDKRFALTPLGDRLRSDAADPVAPWAAFIGRPYFWQAWGHLLHGVRTGENAFQHVHGTDVWTYRSEHAEEGAIFDRAMSAISRGVIEGIVGSYDFGLFPCVVDVGGGQGALLAGILRSHQAARGILFDQPHVVTGADELLRKAGVADRCEVVAGSFFERVPETGDAYLLKAILHDWDDEAALAILRTCRRAMRLGCRLLVLERLIGPPNEQPEAKFSDLNMMVSPGGQERTRAAFAALFAAAGFRLVGVTPTGTRLSVIEGLPA